VKCTIDPAYAAHQLQQRLKEGRDSMIAHMQGTAFNLSHGVITTLWPISAAVAWDDVPPLLACTGPLHDSLRAHHWTLLGGESAEDVRRSAGQAGTP
jgi:hypothetical protein